MPLVHDRAICLRRLDYSETSQILLLFGRKHGLLRVIAKGAHRRTKAGASKFDGGLDLLDVGRAVVIYSSEKELSTLTEWGLVEGHLELRRSLRGIYLAQYAAELVYSLMEEHDPHPELFDLLEQTLIELAKPTREQVFLLFELFLLRTLGYLPRFGSCSSCGRSNVNAESFSVTTGGIVCKDCESLVHDRVPLDPRLIRLTQSLLRAPSRLPQLTRHQTDPLNRVLAAHIEQTLNKRLRTTKYVLT